MSEFHFETYAIVNIVIIVFYFLFLFRGARKGFLLQIISVLGSLLSFVLAWRYSAIGVKYYMLLKEEWNPLANTVFADVAGTWLNRILWFIVLFIILKLIFLILEKLAGGLQSIPVLKQLSMLLGALLGCVSATIWILIITMILNQPFFSKGRKIANESLLSVISNTVSENVAFLKEPLTDTEKFNKLMEQVDKMDDSDMDTIEELLHQFGFSTLEEQEEQ